MLPPTPPPIIGTAACPLLRTKTYDDVRTQRCDGSLLMDFLEAVLVDDKMKDDDYLGPDLLILEDVEAIPSEDHVSVSP